MSLVRIYPTFTVPFCTWLLMGFFKSLPWEVEESAMVDGGSRFGAIARMVLHLSKPGLLTVVIFTLTLMIQEFVYFASFDHTRLEAPSQLIAMRRAVSWRLAVSRVKPFSEPAVDRYQQLPRLGPLALLLPEPAQTHGRAQL